MNKLCDDIEMTPEWTELLYQECLSSDFTLLSAKSGDATLFFMRSKRQKWWKHLSLVHNYYTSIAGPIGLTSSSQAEHLLETMLEQDWHIAQWGPLELGAPFSAALLKTLENRSLPCIIEPAFVNWQLRFSDSVQEYFEQLPAKLRSTLRRKQRKLEKESEDWQFQIIQTPEALAQSFRDYEEIYQVSWKPEESHINFIRQMCDIASSSGWLRLGILSIDQQAVAAQIWFVYEGKASIFKLAYRPEFQAYSPGTLLTAHLMRHVLSIDQVRLVDFGTGDEPYKADWMNYKNTRYTITSFHTQTVSGKLAQLRYQWLPTIKRKLLNHD